MTHRYSDFQEQIARQTNLTASQQILIYDGDHFNPEPAVSCEYYPDTSEEKPIMVLPHGFSGHGTPIPPYIRE